LSKNELSWSEWFSFDKNNISNVPSKPGVFRMHAAMKILYIGNSDDLQKKLLETLTLPCTREASRFCYIVTTSHEKLKENVMKSYLEKHDGKLPKCM